MTIDSQTYQWYPPEVDVEAARAHYRAKFGEEPRIVRGTNSYLELGPIPDEHRIESPPAAAAPAGNGGIDDAVQLELELT